MFFFLFYSSHIVASSGNICTDGKGYKHEEECRMLSVGEMQKGFCFGMDDCLPNYVGFSIIIVLENIVIFWITNFNEN
jgi:hypothetical protein